MKRFTLLLIMLIVLSSMIACGKTQLSHASERMTPEQVISQVQVYGVPTLKHGGEVWTRPASTYLWGSRTAETVTNPTYMNAAPVGQWAAVYEGNDQWRVQGSVVFSVEQENRYYTTTWLYSSTRLQLVSQSSK